MKKTILVLTILLIGLFLIFGCTEPSEVSDCKKEATTLMSNPNNPSLNDKITYNAMMDVCITKKAVETNNNQLCNYLEYETAKQRCITEVNN